MPKTLFFALALLAGCGSEDRGTVVLEDEAVEAAAVDPAPRPAADATPAVEPDASTPETPRRTTAECRQLAERFAEAEVAGIFQAVPEHTFAFTTARDSGACFMTMFRDITAAQLAPGEPFPYQYHFVIDENGETRHLDLEQTPTSSAVTAVGFEDINDDGTDDIFVVHDGEAASLAFASDADDETGWRQLFVDNGEAGIFVETVAELKDAWRGNTGD